MPNKGNLSKKVTTKSMERLTNTETQLNLNFSQNDEINSDFLYCWKIFNKRPNKTTIPGKFNAGKMWSYIEDNLIYQERNLLVEKDVVNEFFVITEYKKILIHLDNDTVISFRQVNEFYTKENEHIIDIYEFNIYYSNKTDFIAKLESDIVSMVEDEYTDEDLEQKREFKNKLLKFDNENSKFALEVMDSFIKIDTDNIELYYNSDTYKKIKKWIKSLKLAKKGLSILFSDRGCGKTSLLSHIMNKVDQKIIYIPSYCIEHVLHNPEFIEILKISKDTIYIIDDCENYFNRTYQKTTTVVNNLLQMIDGIRSDTYNANFILSMNCEKSFCDDNLFSCNNIIDIIELNKLESDEATVLSEHLGFKVKYIREHKLNDVVRGIEKTNKGIGFI